MKTFLFAGLAALSLAGWASSADAKRTVIDQQDDGTTIEDTLFGYCDLTGEDCAAKPLGYSFTFENGLTVNSIIIYGNGMISFGDTPVSLAGVTPDIPEYPPLDYFGNNVLSAGFNNDVTQDFQGGRPDTDVFNQAGLLFIDSTSARATWYTCISTGNCTDYYYADIKRVANGLEVSLSGSPTYIQDTGTVIGNKTYGFNQNLYVIPGTFGGLSGGGGVPEPGTWAMLLLGFGAVGWAARHRRGGVKATVRI